MPAYLGSDLEFGVKSMYIGGMIAGRKKMIDYDRIKKDCFWDLNISIDEIADMISGSDFRSKAFLFEKILLNSTKLLRDLRVFKIYELKLLLEGFKVPQFNYEYVFRRKNIAEVYLFDKPLLIDELKWIA